MTELHRHDIVLTQMVERKSIKEKIFSVIIPAFNEEENIIVMSEKLIKTLAPFGRYEIIYVDDGSTDNTLGMIKNVMKTNQNIQHISFSRNFGHQNALKAGLDHTSGDCVITMDADLQHPPELIPEMISMWRDGFDIVHTIRKTDKKISFLKRTTARLFYGIINRISEVKIMIGTADFRLMDRSVVEELKKITEHAPFYRGIVPWTGFRQTGIHYDPSQRHAGYSKYSFTRMMSFAVSGITSFSVTPLRIATFLGFIMAISGFAVGLIAIYEILFTDNAVPGWASTIVSVVFVGGVQLIVLGIIGEYLGKLFIESKKRPHYIIRESSLFEKEK